MPNLYSVPDGAVLIHTNTGDLLRSLEPPEGYSSPRLLCLNREGYIIVYYEKGGLCSFGVNGKTLRFVTHNDNVQVLKSYSSTDEAWGVFFFKKLFNPEI